MPSNNDQHRSDTDVPSSLGRAFERHYAPKEVARLWHKDEDTIRRVFGDEPGVLRFPSMNRRKGTRHYVSLTIPESVVIRVHERLEVKENIPRKPRSPKGSASPVHGNIQPRPASSTYETGNASDLDEKQWEQMVVSTARKLKSTALKHGK